MWKLVLSECNDTTTLYIYKYWSMHHVIKILKTFNLSLSKMDPIRSGSQAVCFRRELSTVKLQQNKCQIQPQSAKEPRQPQRSVHINGVATLLKWQPYGSKGSVHITLVPILRVLIVYGLKIYNVLLVFNINLHQEEDQEILLLAACSKSDLYISKQIVGNNSKYTSACMCKQIIPSKCSREKRNLRSKS